MNFKKILIASILMISGIAMANAGYGIDCIKPMIIPSPSHTSVPISFLCTNNTPKTTFTSFSITANVLRTSLPPVTLSVAWPHSANNIQPGDVGIVTGTVVLPSSGKYSFDFTKVYNGETYPGIFCSDGNFGIRNCVNIQAT